MTPARWNAQVSDRATALSSTRTLAVAFLIAAHLAGCETPGMAEKDYDARVSEVVLAAAVEAERQYDYENAVRHFETLYERDRTNAKVVRDLARNLRYAGVPKQAIKLLRRAMRKSDSRPVLLLELAKAQLAASELADAEATLTVAGKERALEGEWQYHLVWGIYLDRKGRFSEAQSAYGRALEISPERVAILNNLALSYAMSGEIDKGVDLLRKIVEDENSTKLTRQNLALLYGIKGKMNEAGTLTRRDLPKSLAERNLGVFRQFHE